MKRLIIQRLLAASLIAILFLSSVVPLPALARPEAQKQASPEVADQTPPAAEIEAELLARFAAQGQADFIVRFEPQADLSVANALDWQARGEYVYQALLAASAAQEPAKAYLDSLGLKHVTFLAGNDLYVYSGNVTTAQSLAQLDQVASIRETRTYFIEPVSSILSKPYSVSLPVDQPEAAYTWGILDTKADQFWAQYGTQGDGIVIAGIDTGVQYDHPGLIGAFKCASPSDPACWSDPENGCGGSACDTHGHGTHTMGTMVATDDNPSLPYIAGMAPSAKWIACKGCSTSSCSDFALNSCADWILAPGGSSANRPHIVNNSWGGSGGNTWYQAKVNAWRAAGIFPAFSAGNSGPSCSTLGSPGDYQETLGTAAHDVNRNIGDFSSRGASFFGHDPYTKPNISSPGVDICSTIPGSTYQCGWNGTSMASPHTAGAVALLWDCNPNLIGLIDTTIQALQNSADAPPAGSCGAPPDGQGNYTFGYGYLNVLQAAQNVCGTPSIPDISVAPTSLASTQQTNQVVAKPFIISNLGGGSLNWQIDESNGLLGAALPNTPRSTTDTAPASRPAGGPLAFGDMQFEIDFTTPTADSQILGVEYLGGNYWVTGGNSGNDPNLLYKVSPAGVLLASYYQPVACTGWGGRDLATDGTYLYYGCDDGYIYETDPSNGVVTGMIYVGHLLAPARALAYDPATNHFWSANWDSNLYEIDRYGNLINAFAPVGRSTYGMAWDNVTPGGPYLWLWSQDGTDPLMLASQVNPATGALTGLSFAGVGVTGDMAGGAAISGDLVPGKLAFLGLNQGMNDRVGVYELATTGGSCIPSDIPWATVVPASGATPGGTYSTVNVNFYSNGLGVGTYTGQLCINSNDPDEPQIPLGLTLEVTAEGVPDISVNPTSLSSTLFPGQFDTQNLTISNPGSANLIFTLVESPEVTWLTLGTSGTTLGPGGSQLVNVIFNASSLAAGTYYTSIVVSSNDPDQPQVIVPVSLTVNGANTPDIGVTPTSLSAKLYPGQSTLQSLMITNAGSGDLTFSLSENPAAAWLSVSPTGGTVSPGGSYPVNVSFDATGMAPATYITALDLASNDPDEPVLHVYITLRVLSTVPIIYLPNVFDHARHVNPIIPETTELVSQETTQHLVSVSPDGSTYTFNQLTNELAQLSAGDIMVAGVTATTPNGFLRKVTSLNQQGSNVVVVTTPAAMERAVEAGSLSAHVELSPAGIESSTLAPGVTMNTPENSPDGLAFEYTFLDLVLDDADGNLGTTNDQIVANGSLTFEQDFDFNFAVENFKLTYLSFIQNTEETAELTVESEISYNNKKTVEIASHTFTPITFWIGWFPVVIVPKLSVYVGYDGSVHIGVTTGVSQVATTSSGLRYENGRWNPVNTRTNSFDFTWPTLSAGLSLKGFAGIGLDLKLYGIAGPYAKANAYLKLEANPLIQPWWKLYGGLQIPVGVKLEILSNLVASYETTVLDLKIPLLQANIPPILPANPFPPNGSIGNSQETGLTWTGGDLDNDSVTYDVYFEAWDATPDVLLCNDVYSTYCSPGYLALATTYYWQVIARDEHGELTYGPVWSFNTTVGNTYGNLHGTVVSAMNGQPIYGATLCIQSTSQCDTSDSYGYYEINSIPTGDQILVASASGFVTIQQNVAIFNGQTSTLNLALSPTLAQGEVRIVLTWGENPRDLDSHLWLPSSHPYHIYFGSKGSCSYDPYACLDLDDTSGFGPETVTISQRFTGTYVYGVYLYAGTGTLPTSGAKVQVYTSSGLIKEYYVPTSGSGSWWHVFNLDGTTGAIYDMNYLTPFSPGPY